MEDDNGTLNLIITVLLLTGTLGSWKMGYDMLSVLFLGTQIGYLLGLVVSD